MELLGKKISYYDKYSPEILDPVERKKFTTNISVYGYDLWNLYELSWLDKNGKPFAAIGRIIYNCNSKYIIESKSLKLYLNSFNNHSFESIDVVTNTIKKDLSEILHTDVIVEVFSLDIKCDIIKPDGVCIDDTEIQGSCNFNEKESYLKSDNEKVLETFYSNLLRSNCPVTNQPDWGTVIIKYGGGIIDKARFLKYIISYRNHCDFHETCVESIYFDVMQYCNPEKLSIIAHYTRRGGVDINPFRTNDLMFKMEGNINRLIRQ